MITYALTNPHEYHSNPLMIFTDENSIRNYYKEKIFQPKRLFDWLTMTEEEFNKLTIKTQEYCKNQHFEYEYKCWFDDYIIQIK